MTQNRKTTKRNHAAPQRIGGHSGNHAAQAWFSRFAQETSHVAGKPVTFLLALAIVLVWAATGPLFDYSDTWQLVINTGTTIVTFLMVFLIQNTQNRDTLALQLKLSELVLASKDVEDRFATIEDMTEQELEELHDDCRKRADHVLQHLENRRVKGSGAAGQQKPKKAAAS